MIKAEEQDNSHIGAAGHDEVDEEQETMAHLNLTDGWELMAEGVVEVRGVNCRVEVMLRGMEREEMESFSSDWMRVMGGCHQVTRV